jgi:hypothetical protein
VTNDWDLGEPSSYSPDNFYTQITKDAVQRGFRLRQSENRLIDIIVAQRRFPQIETAADFFRDAVHHRLVHLMQSDPEGSNTLRRERTIMSLMTLESERRETDAKVHRIVAEVMELRSLGHAARADTLLQAVIAEVEGMDEDYWKSRWVERLQASFGMQYWGGE